MAGRSKRGPRKIEPDQILGRKSDYDKTIKRIAAEDLGDIEHQIMVRQAGEEASQLPTERERRKYLSNKLKGINELLYKRGLLWERDDPRFQREYAQEYLGSTPELGPGDILRRNRATDLEPGGGTHSAYDIVEQGVKKGGKIKKKKKKKKSKSKTKKIMYGYKAGGKV